MIEYPGPPGAVVPDLGLAQFGVSTPLTQVYINTDSTPPDMSAPPPLVGADEIGSMGIDPGEPYQHLQLANDFQVKTPGELAAPAGIGSVNSPTWHTPDMSVPSLKPADISADEIEHVGEFEPDPHTGDLLQFAQPAGLTVIAAWNGDPLAPDPAEQDLDGYDVPAGLVMRPPLEPDPTVPDLQSPQLEQDVHMSGRPGDLADGALDAMDETKGRGDNELPTDNYNELYMEQRGENNHRARHMGMMELGLEKEERG